MVGLDVRNLRTMVSRTMLVHDLKARVARHEYDVNCHAVAEALLARHRRCSNPASVRSPRASASVTPATPPDTIPTWLTDGSAPGGPHTSSS